MRLLQLLLLAALLSIFACKKDDALPATQTVMVKFENKTGYDIKYLSVSRAEVGDLKKGKTSEYFSYEQFGQQFGFALVEAVGTIDGKKYFTGSACQGICGTSSAPHGTWLNPGYYKIGIYIAKNEPNALEFKLLD
ncbi:MAG: hypothetical protein GC192_03740 [Bacteroidetes bacterium]|nr:hypothetical protein [Bacteroidota bacterium]